jgi:AcrR family transcriptional regulator
VAGSQDSPDGQTLTVAPAWAAQRKRILAAALDLIATHGVDGMTMRQLGAACGLNIATLYHYFGSKSELLGAVIDERNYDGFLRGAPLPIDTSLPPRERLARFLEVFWAGVLGEKRVWRVLIGEGLRDAEVALEAVRRLAGGLESAVDRWLGELFPELPRDHAPQTTVVVGQVLAFFLENLLLPEADRPASMRRRATATAQVIFPADAPRAGSDTDPQT